MQPSLPLHLVALAAAATLAVPRVSAQEPAPAPAQPAAAAKPAFETLTKVMPDGVRMTADWYAADPAAQREGAPPIVVVCCHMAQSSRGEYRVIAPELVRLGCSVLAIDQRSGGKRFDVENETAKHAAASLGGTQGFQASYGDIGFAVEWAHERVRGAKVVLLGSSYSAALAIRYAARADTRADRVLAYSPGEYLNDWSVAADAKLVQVPVYVTCGSGAREKEKAEPVALAIPEDKRQVYWPPDAMKAAHGSQALLPKDAKDRELAWAPVVEVLKGLAP